MLCFLAPTVFASGAQESRMVKARELIAARNYDDAILLLTQVVREEPDREVEAQDLIRQIGVLRNQFNQDYADLIDLLAKEDNDAALKVIAKLEALDANPNSETKQTVVQAKRKARLNVNQAKYRSIVARAQAALAKKAYGQAVGIYLEGTDLARDMFLESGVGNILPAQIDREWEAIRAAATAFAAAETKLKALAGSGGNLLTSEAPKAADLEALTSSLRDLAAWRNRAALGAQFFRAQNDFLVKNSRQQEPYLSYSALLATGAADAAAPEGIAGAMERQWTDAVGPWTAALKAAVEGRWTAAQGAFDQGRWTEASAAFGQAAAVAARGADLSSQWNQWVLADAEGAIEASHRTRLKTLLPLGLWFQERLALARRAQQACADRPEGDTWAARTDLDRAGLVAARAAVLAEKQRFTAAGADLEARDARWKSLGFLGYTSLEAPAFLDAWAAVWAAGRQQALDREIALVDRRGALDDQVLETRTAAFTAALVQARTLMEAKQKDPRGALSLLEAQKGGLDALAGDVAAFVAAYEGESDDVRSTVVRRWPEAGRALAQRVAEAQGLRTTLAQTAQVSYTKSQDLKKAGQDLRTSVESATAGENFTQARTLLDTISSRFSQSLALQEDPAFRQESDALIQELFALILKGENEVVVREVRRLIIQGSQAYLAQQFKTAEDVLSKAQRRWAQTNAEPNSEVEYWLSLANYAQSVTSGRELSPIDPLYNEVRQLLNFAQRDFDEGRKKDEAGNDAGAQVLYQSALASIDKVRIPFPVNQEANLLRLQVLQVQDPQAFPTVFKQLFDQAVARIDTDASRAYSDLQDLDKIQDGFPGMAAAIKKVRQVLNLDRPAVDLRVVNEAKNLVAQAQKTFDAGNPAQYASAQALVRRALQLDPTNGPGQLLFDKISLKLSGTVATLTPTQLGELNEILDLLRTQRTLEALDQITRFKAKYPAVASETRVKEAERRIKAVN